MSEKSIIKKLSIFFSALFFSLAVLTPVTQGLIEQTMGTSSTEDFSITIHRIKEEDEIDPWPHGDVDWRLTMYVNNVQQVFECVGNDIFIDENFIWPDIIKFGDEYVFVQMTLIDLDPWPDTNDVADISAYQGGGPDNTNDIPRGATFKRAYDLINKEWVPVDGNNDYLNTDIQPYQSWYITSGNYDGSTNIDENDASIWFNISVGNTPPYPPEKPTGTGYGWEGNIYEFSTRGNDVDGEQIQFAWDWDGDGDVDEVTGFYDSWETVTVPHIWTQGRVYYVKVMAIDSRGLQSEWSEPLKVKMNSITGINGVEVEDWTLGHVYTLYYDHATTQELLNILQSSGNIIAAVSAVIAAMAAACGVPVPYAAVIAIVTALLRLGIEVLCLLDQGMGIYVKHYFIEVGGVIVGDFCYVWSQSGAEGEGEPPVGNNEPLKPEKPEGRRIILPGREYSFSTVASDPDEDKIAYIFEWGDGTYNCSDALNSGEKISMPHTYKESGKYQIRVKVLDIYGQESTWSDPFTITIVKNKQSSSGRLINLMDRIMGRFDSYLLRQIFYFFN